jgi:hypothetical protein
MWGVPLLSNQFVATLQQRKYRFSATVAASTKRFAEPEKNSK